MRSRLWTSVTRHDGTRGFCAWGAAVAAGLVLLGVLGGCSDTVQQDVRQGAYGVFQTGLSTFYSSLSSDVVSGLQGLDASATSP